MLHRVIAIFGIAFALAGITHGVFEILQVGTLKPGLYIDSIGPLHRNWPEGNDPAISVLPGFLISGVVTVGLGLVLIWLCLMRLNRPIATWQFLGLFVAQTLSGGGIGYIPFYLTAWAYLVIPTGARPAGAVARALGQTAILIAIVGAILWMLALGVSVLGIFPGLDTAGAKLTLIWSSLLGSFIALNLSALGGRWRSGHP